MYFYPETTAYNYLSLKDGWEKMDKNVYFKHKFEVQVSKIVSFDRSTSVVWHWLILFIIKYYAYVSVVNANE